MSSAGLLDPAQDGGDLQLPHACRGADLGGHVLVQRLGVPAYDAGDQVGRSGDGRRERHFGVPGDLLPDRGQPGRFDDQPQVGRGLEAQRRRGQIHVEVQDPRLAQRLHPADHPALGPAGLLGQRGVARPPVQAQRREQWRVRRLEQVRIGRGAGGGAASRVACASVRSSRYPAQSASRPANRCSTACVARLSTWLVAGSRCSSSWSLCLSLSERTTQTISDPPELSDTQEHVLSPGQRVREPPGPARTAADPQQPLGHADTPGRPGPSPAGSRHRAASGSAGHRLL